ncbi:MAG TPA: OsmC family protein [Jatrophihabitantaceae bacterium]|nr:OsmC family protein [Jatrophihabitantaceae bacterium]
MDSYGVTVGAGTLRSSAEGAVHFPHRWTTEGVTVDSAFTGAHLLHLAVAGCVLNDLYREAEARGVAINGVRVTASGGFDTQTWTSTGISYRIELDTPAPPSDRDRLIEAVDVVAEIPRAIRAGAAVARSEAGG